jgi:protein TonB
MPVEGQQTRRLVLALILLLVALTAVLITDRQFWFGSEQATIESDVPEPVATTTTPAVAPKTTEQIATKAVKTLPVAAKKHVAAAQIAAEPKPADSPVVTNRTVLAPLDVEIVAGDIHRTVRPGTNATKVGIPNGRAAAPAVTQPAAPAPATNAAELEPMAESIQLPQASLTANYPLLAQHMNVQGSVVLQAVISANGAIQNLRVLSGPAILAAAAEQAVREWRFKPVLQNGQPVETKARITVNFTIKVADNPAKAS